MTEIQSYQERELSPVAAAQDPTGGRLVAWAQAASAANRLASALSRTSFVPAAFKGNDNDATAAIIMGDELGLSPMAALRNIFVVHGTPSMYARTMVALAQNRGHEVWTEESADSKVTVCGRRAGSDKVERCTWTIARARQAGYTSNKKYQTDPQAMLYAKAAAEVCRRIAADALAGIPCAEEQELEQPEPKVTVRRSERKATVKRDAPQAEEPELDESAPVAEDNPEPSGHHEFAPETTSNPDPPAGITKSQLSKLHILMKETGLERDQMIAMASQIAERDIESSKELTKEEASILIDGLTDPVKEAVQDELQGDEDE